MGQIFNRIKEIFKTNLIEEDIPFVAPDLSDEDEHLKREIDEAFRNSTKVNSPSETTFQNISLEKAYNILGLGIDATFEEVKIAYKKKVREYHPDFVENLGKEIQDLAKKKIQEINYAYELIKKAKGK
ncbi:MAG: J domain-containing protein [Candidatus Kapaibacteriota bacterium]